MTMTSQASCKVVGRCGSLQKLVGEEAPKCAHSSADMELGTEIEIELGAETMEGDEYIIYKNMNVGMFCVSQPFWADLHWVTSHWADLQRYAPSRPILRWNDPDMHRHTLHTRTIMRTYIFNIRNASTYATHMYQHIRFDVDMQRSHS